MALSRGMKSFRPTWPTLCAGLVVLSCLPTFAAAPASTNDFLFIDNGSIRVGVQTQWGAGIAWISESGSNRNLINHWDHGRLIQQSYYGEKDGSLWNKTPWNWNPVQGGDWKGNPAKVLSLTSGTDWIKATTQAKHWASGLDLTNVIFEEHIRLRDRGLHVRFKMSYSGPQTHPERDHEIPAFFVNPDLDTLVFYDGSAPWTGGTPRRHKPGWPNEYYPISENWCAYVDSSNFGIGAWVPVSSRITCYRYGDGKAEHGACSYFAPLTKFPITPGLVFEYDLHIAVGSVDQIRASFQKLNPRPKPTKP